MKNSKNYFHHQTYPTYGNHYSSRSRWFTMRIQEILDNRFIIYILTLLRLVILLPYKCVMTVVRSVADIGSGKEHDSCEYGSVKYYIYCGLSGMLSCGITHTALVPLDLIKCRLQVKPQKYVNLISGFTITVAEEGIFGLTKGWAPTLIGFFTRTWKIWFL